MSKYKVLYAEANFGEDEIGAVLKVLNEQRHNMVASVHVDLFQERVASLFGKQYGVMSNSGSSANLLALAACQFKVGKNVVTPSLTFSTTVAPIVQTGLHPNFVDCDLETLQIDVHKIEAAINKDTVAIMVPNLIGNLPDWAAIRTIADKFNLTVIEDSADTIGYKIAEEVGNPYTDVSTTSFYASHIVTGAGTGGMTCFNSEKLKDKALSLRGWGRRSSQYGETEDVKRRLSAAISGMDYDDKYIFDDLGYNFLPSEISAAFALEQIKKLEVNITNRLRNFEYLSARLQKHARYIKIFKSRDGIRTNWLAFPLLLTGEANGKRKLFQEFMEAAGIQTRTIFTGNILRHPAMNNVEHIGHVDLQPNADEVMRNGILLGCHSRLQIEQIEFMADVIDKFIERYCVG